MADSESYVWPEGQLWIWTGVGVASAVVAYAQNSRLNFAYGIVNRETVSGIYYDYSTGKRVDITVQAVMCFDGTLRRMIESATAMHMKFMNSSIAGSAGYLLYSGRIDTFALDGSENNPFTWNMAAHFNQWSGF